MLSLSSSLRKASLSFSASSLLRSHASLNSLFSNIHSGCFETQNLASADVAKYKSFSWNSGIRLGFSSARDGVSGPYALNFQKLFHSEVPSNTGRVQSILNSARDSSSEPLQQNSARAWRSSRPFDFVKDQVLNNRPQMYQNSNEQTCDVVSMFIGRNNTKIHLTDHMGNGKAYVSAGCLPEMKTGAKLSRYAAEATAEWMGRKARELGVKSVVVKVNGLMYFKKKRQAVMSFREGYTGSQSRRHPIIHIEDTTRLAHNGCRLKKRRRI